MIESRNQTVLFFDERYLNSQGGKHAGVFTADDAAAHDQHRGRHLVQVDDGVGVVDARIVERKILGPVRVRTCGNQRDVALDFKWGTALGLDSHRVRVHKRRLAHIDRDVMPAQILHDAGAFRFLDNPLAAEEITDRHLLLESAKIEVVKLALAKAGQNQRRLAHGLRRKGAGICGGAAQNRLALNQGHALAKECGLRCALFSSRAGAYHDQIKLFGHSRVVLYRRSSRE